MSQALFAPVRRALVALDPRVLSENYDEFQNDAEITRIIESNPFSILRVDMAHCQPGSPFKDLKSEAELDFAAKTLDAVRQEGIYEEKKDFYFVYRIVPTRGTGNPNADQIGLGGLANTALIHDPKENPTGRIIRNEAIFPHKAEGRAKLIKRLGATIGLVNLCDPDDGRSLENALRKVAASRRPDIQAVDRKNDLHQVWLVTDAKECAAFTDLMANREVFVADGNHRSKAAQMLGKDRFLSVIFAGGSMNIDPYHRIMKLPLAEKELVDTLGWDAGDERISYVGGDYGPAWLESKVKSGEWTAAFAMPAMTMPEFYAINRSRQMLPRKTTWFTPKIRSGLVIGLD